MTYLGGLIVVVLYECMYECRPPPFRLAVCRPRQPIGDAAGLGEVESGKPGTLLALSCTAVAGGGGKGREGHGFSYLRWVTYNLPSWSRRPQELARDTVKKLLEYMLEGCQYNKNNKEEHICMINQHMLAVVT
jgi:hypothetical protein